LLISRMRSMLAALANHLWKAPSLRAPVRCLRQRPFPSRDSSTEPHVRHGHTLLFHVVSMIRRDFALHSGVYVTMSTQPSALMSPPLASMWHHLTSSPRHPHAASRATLSGCPLLLRCKLIASSPSYSTSIPTANMSMPKYVDADLTCPLDVPRLSSVLMSLPPRYASVHASPEAYPRHVTAWLVHRGHTRPLGR